MKKILVIITLCVSQLFAQDPATYNTYCIACHGNEGQGLKAANFPPLANSEWVQGDANRAIRVVLHGLMGEVTVAGDTYNSVMPAQGSILNDEQIAQTLNFVRSNWGNSGQQDITADTVAKVRAQYPGRTAPWQSAELLQMYPLGGGASSEGGLEYSFSSDTLSPTFTDASGTSFASTELSAGFINTNKPNQKVKIKFSKEHTDKDNSVTYLYEVNGAHLYDTYTVINDKQISRRIKTRGHWPKNIALVVASSSNGHLESDGYNFKLGDNFTVNSYYKLGAVKLDRRGNTAFTYPLLDGENVILSYTLNE